MLAQGVCVSVGRHRISQGYQSLAEVIYQPNHISSSFLRR